MQVIYRFSMQVITTSPLNRLLHLRLTEQKGLPLVLHGIKVAIREGAQVLVWISVSNMYRYRLNNARVIFRQAIYDGMYSFLFLLNMYQVVLLGRALSRQPILG